MPTRVTSQSATIIDHIWSNNCPHSIFNGILYNKITDHFPVFSLYKHDEISISTRQVNRKVKMYRDFSTNNISNFRESLKNATWDLTYVSDDASVAYTNFAMIFNALFGKHFPLKSKTFNSNHEFKPYITPDIKNLIKEKNKLARKYAKRPITYGERFRRLRNQVTLAIRTAKANYNKARLEQNSGNSKKNLEYNQLCFTQENK